MEPENTNMYGLVLPGDSEAHEAILGDEQDLTLINAGGHGVGAFDVNSCIAGEHQFYSQSLFTPGAFCRSTRPFGVGIPPI